ncbi:MAG TPA: phage tail protein [Myxococcaceae bacterium]|jgi:phage tail-like protein
MRSSEIQRLLPGVFQRTTAGGTPLAAALEVMSALHAPSEAVLRDLDRYFDPRRTAERFVPLLAGWMDLEVAQAAPPGRLRELTAAAFGLSQRRGTARGLIRFLEIATGATGFQVDERVPGADGMPRPFHVRITVPAAAADRRDFLVRIIEREKPAHVTYELAVQRT